MMINKQRRFGCIKLMFLVLSLFSMVQASIAGNLQNNDAAGYPTVADSGLDIAIQGLADDISSQMKQKNIKRVAVDAFANLDGFQSLLGDFVSEELVTRFCVAGMDSFDVVERRALARVLKEQRQTSDGKFDKASVSRIGELLGVEAIVTGSIADLGHGVKINARVISVENARVFAAAYRKVDKDEAIEAMIRKQAPVISGFPVASVPSGSRYRNDFLSVDLSSVEISKDRRELTLTLDMKNTTNEALAIVLKDRVAVIDAWDGRRIRLSSHRDMTGLKSCRDRKSHRVNLKNYTDIPPGDTLTVTLKFMVRKPIKSPKVSLIMEMFKYAKKVGPFFTVGFPEIKISSVK